MGGKKLFVALGLLLFSFLAAAESYKIEGVEFILQGVTKERELSKKAGVEVGKTFSTKEELDSYTEKVKQRLINLRLFEQVDVTWSEGAGTEDGFQEAIEGQEGPEKKAFVKIQTKDSRHFLFFPYPKYDSNKGLELKFKVKDDNLFGLMAPLSFDTFFLFEKKPGHDKDFVAGGSLKYDLPFYMGPVVSSWNNDLSFEYAFVRGQPEWNLNTGFSFTLPLKRLSFRLDVAQGFVKDNDYKIFGDDFYFTEEGKFSVPITIREFERIGKLVYTPYAKIYAAWDGDNIHKQNEDLASPRLSFGHQISLGQVNWTGNFRKGWTGSILQSMTYNFSLNEFLPGVEVLASGFYSWKYAGVNARALFLFEKKSFSRYAHLMRGIPDDALFSGHPESPNNFQAKGELQMVFNIDFPIHLFFWDWEKFGIKKLNFFNVDVQAAPFVDIALGKNRKTGRVFDARDGFYAAGLELLVFPEKWKSIVIRTSAGLDIGNLLFKKYIDTSWRDNKASNYEFTVGIGLFY